MEEQQKVKKSIFKKWWFWVIIVIVGLYAIGNSGDKSNNNSVVADNRISTQETITTKAEDKFLEITATMDFKIIDKQAIVTINSNIADGGIFEITVMDDEMKTLSDFVPINQGIIEKKFDIPEEWGVTNIACISMFRFNLAEHPQPQTIIDLYGVKGEKMKGDIIQEHIDGFKLISFDPVGLAYPSEEAVQEASVNEYKSVCKTIKYGTLARNADTLKNEKVVYKGQVIQVLEDGNNIQMRVDVTVDEYGFWEDTVFVMFTRGEADTRILEEDIIQFWGEVGGLITYESVLGGDITIPQINAEYISILEGK